MSKEYDELKQLIESKDEIINTMGQEIAELQAVTTDRMIYNFIDSNMPEWARPAVQWAVGQGIVQGDGDGLGLDDKDLRWLVIMYRAAGNK